MDGTDQSLADGASDDPLDVTGALGDTDALTPPPIDVSSLFDSASSSSLSSSIGGVFRSVPTWAWMLLGAAVVIKLVARR